MTSLTAYFGILDIGKVQPGDFVVVSGAAGATGSVVGQIAKIKGATVLGIAGSEEKVKWLKELGFDDALNYRDPEFARKFRKATPVGFLLGLEELSLLRLCGCVLITLLQRLIDVFFDNGKYTIATNLSVYS